MFEGGATTEEFVYWMGEGEDTRDFIASVLSTIAAIDSRRAVSSRHALTCIHCQIVISPALANLGSIACHSCRSCPPA